MTGGSQGLEGGHGLVGGEKNLSRAEVIEKINGFESIHDWTFDFRKVEGYPGVSEFGDQVQ